MWKRFSMSTASRAWRMAVRYWGRAMAARMPMMAITVMSSMRVKPRARPSPGVVARAIQSFSGALAVDVPHVLAAPGRLVRIILVASHAPLGLGGHGVHGDPAEQLDLPVLGPHAVDPRDQDLQSRRVPLAPELHV